jgi:hypothetical protein
MLQQGDYCAVSPGRGTTRRLVMLRLQGHTPPPMKALCAKSSRGRFTGGVSVEQAPRATMPRPALLLLLLLPRRRRRRRRRAAALRGPVRSRVEVVPRCKGRRESDAAVDAVGLSERVEARLLERAPLLRVAPARRGVAQWCPWSGQGAGTGHARLACLAPRASGAVGPVVQQPLTLAAAAAAAAAAHACPVGLQPAKAGALLSPARAAGARSPSHGISSKHCPARAVRTAPAR